MLLFIIYVVLASGIWLVILGVLAGDLSQLPAFSRLAGELDDPGQWPTLSIVVPACNEADEIEASLASLLSQDYPRCQLIVVNDRSVDATGEIIQRLAVQDPRIKTVELNSLPAGWLGKVHALHQGVQHADGDWLLFTDADVHFSPGSLRRAIKFAEAEKLDQLSLLPRLVTKSFWLTLAVRSFGLLFLHSTHASKVHRQDNRYFIGVGAFNMIRRSAFSRTPGFEWLRMEPGDDVGLGMLIKQAGGRVRIARADEDLCLGWYPSLAAMFKGLEKNLFGAAAHYQWWRVLSFTLLLWTLLLAPLAGLLMGVMLANTLLITAVALVLLMHLLFVTRLAKQGYAEPACLLLFPLGLILINLMLINATYRCLRNDGIDWRGTHYSLESLRAGQRVRF